MPRHKVDPQSRRRVARACDNCKRRKEKCDGTAPCGQCLKRRRGDACHYTSPHSSNATRNLLHEEPAHHAEDDHDIHKALCALEDPAPSELSSKNGEPAFLNSAPVPKVSRMLRDSKGKFIYVGESASLSFLQTLRKAMTIAVGSCDFTTDPLRHMMIETAPPARFDNVEEPKLILEEIVPLVDEFFLIASGIIDLFNPSWLIDQLPTWVEDPSRNERPSSSIIYLALAIGAQARAQDEADEMIAEKCFGYGRQIAMLTLMDDPSLMTVQAFILISYYMLAACRRNGAFTNLGVAVRAAYALGIHRHETNVAFVPEEGISRERAWKTLRVCDLFLSASMGRPPGTSDTECNIPWASPEQVSTRERSTVPSQVSSAIFRICHVFERVLVEVYSRKAVSIDLAGSISGQHRQWTKELPHMLKIDGLDNPGAATSSPITHRLGSGIVTMAYYYSIILLTRPFLTFKVCHKPGIDAGTDNGISANAELTCYADACVDSAIKGIKVAQDTIFESGMPRRQPLVINSVFISALCLGLAFLDDYDQRGWPLSRSLEIVISILSHFGRLNPQAAHYVEICQLLKAATVTYVENRDREFLWASSRQVRNLFGDIHEPTTPHIGHKSRPAQSNGSSDTAQFASTITPISPSSYEGSSADMGSHVQASGYHHYESRDIDNLHDLSFDYFTTASDLQPNDHSMTEDPPLFCLTNDVVPAMYGWQAEGL